MNLKRDTSWRVTTQSDDDVTEGVGDLAIYVGIDGGGFKTDALFFNSETKTTVEVAGNASRTSSVGWNTSKAVVTELLREGLAKCGVESDKLASVSVCMSGIDLAEQSVRMQNELNERFLHPSIEVVNDALAALTAGTDGSPGCVLVVGTGSIAMAEDNSGRIARSGGLGYLIGDEGSGYDIGRLGIIRAIQGREGRGPSTSLWDCVSNHFQIQQPRELIPIIYDSEYAVGQIAAFAPQVIACALTDDTACRIIDQSVERYVELVDSARGQLGDTVGNKVVLAGGVITNGSLLLEKLEAARPSMTFEPLQRAPVVGALLRAIRLSAATQSAAM